MATVNKYLSSKLVSKEEASMANSSCRVYYGEAGAIPFMWESQPGTPKHTCSESSLPPLTPPPSYATTPPNPKSTHKLGSSKSKFFGTIFPRLRSSKKAPNMSSPSPSSSLSSASFSSSSWSSSSNSSSSLRNKKGHKYRCFSVSRMPLDNDYGEEYDDHYHHSNSGSPNSTLCFGGNCRGINLNGNRGFYSMKNIKFAFLSIVNHESSRRTCA